MFIAEANQSLPAAPGVGRFAVGSLGFEAWRLECWCEWFAVRGFEFAASLMV